VSGGNSGSSGSAAANSGASLSRLVARYVALLILDALLGAGASAFAKVAR